MSAYTTEYVFSGTAVGTTLAGDVTGGVSVTIPLTSASGWPSPTAGQKSIGTLNAETTTEVKFTYTGKSGNDLTGVAWDYDGTTAAGTYTQGTPVRHGISAEVMNDLDFVKRNTAGLIAGNGGKFFRVNPGATAVETTTLDEIIDDRVDALVTDGNGLVTSYNDPGGALTLSTKTFPLANGTSTTSFASTTAESTLATYTVVGGTLAAGDMLRLHLAGDLTNDTGGSVVYTFKIKFGATTVYDTSTISMTTNGVAREFTIDTLLWCESSTAQRMRASMFTSVPTSGITGWQPLNVTDAHSFVGSTTCAENTATDKALAVTVTMGTSSASASCRTLAYKIEKVLAA